MTNVDQPSTQPNGERVPSPTETPVPPEPEGSAELWVQERDAFDDFIAHIDADDERRPPTSAERAELDARLERLGDIFAGLDVRWTLDGALNISLLAGDYIGVHKDVDISIEPDDLPVLEAALRERGYGLFVSLQKDPNDEKSKRIMRRIGADAARERYAMREPLLIAAIDGAGRIPEDGATPLNFIDVHVVQRDGERRAIGVGGVMLPEAWFAPQPQGFHGRAINRSHPAKVAYYKVFQGRAYDGTDLRKLAEIGALTGEDVDAVARAVEGGIAGRGKAAEDIASRVSARILGDVDAEAIARTLMEDPVVAAAAQRAPIDLKIRALAERIAAGERTIEHIQQCFFDVVLADQEPVHQEWRRKVADLRRWVADVEAANRIREGLGVARPPVEGQQDRKRSTMSRLGDFDSEYFQSLEGSDGWIALGQDNCQNQRYFTVYGTDGEKLGIVGVYDTDDDQHISHTVVDPRFRGQGLAARFKERLMEELDLPFLTLTIAMRNTASLRAAERTSGAYRTSDVSYEQEFQRAKFRLERQPKGEALSIAERRQLVDVWSRVVLGGRVEAPDTDRQTPEEFRAWLHESLMREFAALVEEWGMIADANLVQRIRASEIPAERATLEVEYLRKCQKLFTRRTNAFRPSSERSTKWDSWPDAMRESGEFNCVGSVLLGMQLLEAAGMRQWIGNPVGHVVNIAQLADGSHWYIDFLNRDIRPIQPASGAIAGVSACSLREDGLEYRRLLLLDVAHAVDIVLGNLSALQHDAYRTDADPEDLDILAARVRVKRFPGILDTVDLEPLTGKLSARLHAAMETSEMRAEEARVRALHDLSDDARIRAFQDEIGDRTAQETFLRTTSMEVDLIHRFLAGEVTTCEVVDKRIQRFVEVVADVIASKAKRGTELHRELVEEFVAAVRRVPSVS